ncbi:MAG TPA: carbohydrate-binding family 9-like protein [Bacteroidales bacterium]|nr:carbohydrate-binding family 9-like protein [Bacteroidales bacterium]
MLLFWVPPHSHGMRFSKILEVRKEFFPEKCPDPLEVSSRMNFEGSGHFIDEVNWKEFPYKPEVEFDIRYSERAIFLKYRVAENYFKAEKTSHNDRVWEDSCVEFFIEPAADGIYYNLEFNAIGTCYIGAGRNREERQPLPESVISKLRVFPSSGNKPVREVEGRISWELTIIIPFGVFCYHTIESFEGKEIRANFYKCGDKLKVPHYLSWNPVGTLMPDFHRPEYFGILRFI